MSGEAKRAVSIVMSVPERRVDAHLAVGWVEAGHARQGLDYCSVLIEWPHERAAVFPPREGDDAATG